jgi:hypothetical protein
MAAIVGPFLLASGIFNPNGNPDFVWTGDGGQGLSRWELNASQLELTTTSIQPLWSVDQWTIYGAAHFINNAFGPTSPASQNLSTSQMLMKNANGTMTPQWFDAQAITPAASLLIPRIPMPRRTWLGPVSTTWRPARSE